MDKSHKENNTEITIINSENKLQKKNVYLKNYLSN